MSKAKQIETAIKDMQQLLEENYPDGNHSLEIKKDTVSIVENESGEFIVQEDCAAVAADVLVNPK